ncbi:MAG: hypothetical protein AVDCRST_MAG88-4, partial [uncultured Thermomicrobiales bacterium]
CQYETVTVPFLLPLPARARRLPRGADGIIR